MSETVTVIVSGHTGTGKSAICGEIEIALRAIAFIQLLYAALAGIFLGKDLPQMLGIFFALMCLAPILNGDHR